MSSANLLAFHSDLGLLDDYFIFLGSLDATQIHITWLFYTTNFFVWYPGSQLRGYSSPLSLVKPGRSRVASIRVTKGPGFSRTLLLSDILTISTPSASRAVQVGMINESTLCMGHARLAQTCSLLSLLLCRCTAQLQSCETASGFLDSTRYSSLLFNDSCASLRSSYLVYSNIHVMLVSVLRLLVRWQWSPFWLYPYHRCLYYFQAYYMLNTCLISEWMKHVKVIYVHKQGQEENR